MNAGDSDGFNAGRLHQAFSDLQRRQYSGAVGVLVGGRQEAYSNAGYSLLAAIIETCSDKPYEAFLRDDLLPRNGDPAIGYSSVFESRHSLRTGGGQDVAEASWGHDRPFWNT